MALPAIGSMIVQQARNRQLLSRGLAYGAKKSKNKLLKTLLTAGSGAAGALGFERAIASTPSVAANRPGGRRRGGKRKTRRGSLVPYVAPSATSGALTLGAGNAPVAFARTEDLRPFFRAYPGAGENGLIVHAVDFLGPIGTANAAWGSNYYLQLSPTNSTVHPWLAGIAPLFLRYRPKMLRIHYQHFVGTQTPGQVTLQFFPSPNYNNGVAPTQAQSQNAGNFMTGACYEDFCHTADMSSIDKSFWYNTPTGYGSGSSDDNLYGILGVFTANANAAQASTGNIWVESVYELAERKMSSVTVGVNEFAKVLNTLEFSNEKRRALALRIAMDLIAEANERASQVLKKAKEDKEIDQLESRLSKFTIFGTPREAPGPTPPPPAGGTPVSRLPQWVNNDA